jgi:hypothetical protein
MAVEHHATRIRRLEGHDHARQRRFARAGFPHDPQRLAAIEREARRIDGGDQATGFGQRLARQPIAAGRAFD